MASRLAVTLMVLLATGSALVLTLQHRRSAEHAAKRGLRNADPRDQERKRWAHPVSAGLAADQLRSLDSEARPSGDPAGEQTVLEPDDTEIGEDPPEVVGVAQRVEAGDQTVLNPDAQTSTGEVTTPDGGAPSSSPHHYSVRLERATVAPGQLVMAQVEVTTADGQPVAFELKGVRTKGVANGDIDPLGTWTTTPGNRGQLVKWTPPELALDAGQRQMMFELAIDGEVRILNASLNIQWAPPVAATGEARTSLLDDFVRVEVRFRAKGSWYCQISANLYEASGKPLQHTAWIGAVNEGTWAPLDFSRALLESGGDADASLSVHDLAGDCRSASAGSDEGVVARLDTVHNVHDFKLAAGE